MLGVPAFSALLTVMLVLLSLANHSYRVHALCRPLATKTHPNRVAANSCSDLNCASARDPAGPERMGRALSDWIVGYLLRCAARRRRTAKRCWSRASRRSSGSHYLEPDKFLHAFRALQRNVTRVWSGGLSRRDRLDDDDARQPKEPHNRTRAGRAVSNRRD